VIARRDGAVDEFLDGTKNTPPRPRDFFSLQPWTEARAAYLTGVSRNACSHGGVMREPIKQRGGKLLVTAEDLHPLAEGEVRCHHHALSFVAFGQQVEEQLAARAVEGDESQFVDHEKIDSMQSPLNAPQFTSVPIVSTSAASLRSVPRGQSSLDPTLFPPSWAMGPTNGISRICRTVGLGPSLLAVVGGARRAFRSLPIRTLTHFGGSPALQPGNRAASNSSSFA
jgi:hypothetical protein